MAFWLVRAVGMTVVHVAGQTAMSLVRASAPERVPVAEASILGVVVAVAAGWGAVDGRLRRDRAAMGWLVAALVTGPAAGLLAVLARAAFIDATPMAALWPALTGGAAFTALLVMLPAVAGTGAGRLRHRPAAEHALVEPQQQA